MSNLEGIMKAAQAGDQDAFRNLVEPYLAALYRTCALILLDQDLAKDAVQEALLRAYRHLDRFQEDRPLSPWLHQLAVNEARRLSGRRKRLPFPLSEMPDIVSVNQSTDPEASLMAREDRDRLWEAMSSISEQHRTVLILRYYRSMTEQEMADVLSVPAGTVKSRLHSARKALEKQLGEPLEYSQPRLVPVGR